MTCDEIAKAYWDERDAHGGVETAEALRLKRLWNKTCAEGTDSGGGGQTEPPKPPH